MALCYLPLVLGLALRLFHYRRDELLGRSIQSISPLRQADGRLSSRAGKAFLRRTIAGVRRCSNGAIATAPVASCPARCAWYACRGEPADSRLRH